MDHTLISTTNLEFDFFLFLPKKVQSLFEKHLVTTKLWWLKVIPVTARFGVI